MQNIIYSPEKSNILENMTVENPKTPYVQMNRYYQQQDGTVVKRTVDVPIRVPKGYFEQCKNEGALITAYLARGKVDGEVLPLEEELPPNIVQRARNRAEAFMIMDEIAESEKRPRSKLLQRIKHFFSR